MGETQTKEDCEHVDELKLQQLPSSFMEEKCESCENGSKWFCLTCGKFYCGSNTLGHITEHFKKNPSHCVVASYGDETGFYCYKCLSYLDSFHHSKLLPIYEDLWKQKMKSAELSERVIQGPPKKFRNFRWFWKSEKSKIIEEVTSIIGNCVVLKTRIDPLSKRFGMPNLKKVLRDKLGRKTGRQDSHGVKDFVLDRNIYECSDSDFFEYGRKCKVSVKDLKNQCENFRIHYIKEGITDKSEIRSHFVDKKNGRKWMNIFSKHFYVQISPITVLYDHDGIPLDLSELVNSKEILLCTGVGFDVSAHRLTGVHFGDFLRICMRADGEENFDINENNIDSEENELWEDAMNYWSKCPEYRTKYILDEELLVRDYKIQFSLMFSALQKEGVEVPIICAIGCGVFGNRFYPEYQEAVITAYIELLSEKSYGFKSVCLCEINEKNANVFQSKLELFKGKLKVPFCIVQADMMILARLLSKKFKTCVHNAGDLWEIGQFWEGGGSLEEYCARMTTGYISQHWKINPKILEDQCLVKWKSSELLDFENDEKMKIHFEELKKFLEIIKAKFI